MKKLIKQNCFISLLVCILYACNPTNGLINNVDSELTSVMPSMRSSPGNMGIANAYSFNSIEEVDAMLDTMQSIDNANVFYDTYIRNNSIHNKYLTSIHEYLNIQNLIDGEDTITAMLAFEALRDSLFNVYVDGSDTIAEPLSFFDYRCLVNEDSVFVVGDRTYHLFDTIFITCPNNRHAELVEISRNPLRMQLLIDELKAERKEFDDTTMIKSRALNIDASSFELIKIEWRNASHHDRSELKYEKVINKHRMRVSIQAKERYSSLYNRHDFETKYSIRSHNKWAGIWWIKNESIDVDLNYVAQFEYGASSIEMAHLRKTIPIDTVYHAKGFVNSYKKTNSYPDTHFGSIILINIFNVDFTISNQHMVITEEDFIEWET